MLKRVKNKITSIGTMEVEPVHDPKAPSSGYLKRDQDKNGH